METKKFQVKSDGNKPKGGRNNTQTILTASGIVAAAGVVGYAAGRAEQVQAATEAATDAGTAAGAAAAAAETVAQQESQTSQAQETTQQTNEPTSQTNTNETITEPQPFDTPQQAPHEPQPGGSGFEPEPNGGFQIGEIDPDDIDSEDVLTVEGLTTAYGPDGSEMLVAVVHTPDGGQYLLADNNGDGVYNDVFDMEGNYVGEAEGNLTASDLEEMSDDTGNFISQNFDEPIGDDPTGDIIDTIVADPIPTDEDIANVDVPEDDIISDEELLSQLLDDEDLEGLQEEHLVDEDDDEAYIDDVYSADDVDEV